MSKLSFVSRLFVLVAAIALAPHAVAAQPADKGAKLVSQSTTYSDPDKQRRFKEALKEAGVPFETYTEGGQEHVRWKGEDAAAVKKIQASLFGAPPPQQQVIAFEPPYQEQFKQYLKNNRIPFQTTMINDKEFVTWAAKDYPRVSQYKYFPRQTFEAPK